jgi:hypothetical protein
MAKLVGAIRGRGGKVLSAASRVNAATRSKIAEEGEGGKRSSEV